MEKNTPRESSFNSEFLECPLGWIHVQSNPDGISRVDFVKEISKSTPNSITKECVSQLRAYFEGSLQKFDLSLAPVGSDFQQKVWAELLSIPFGTTISYLDLALRLGDEKLTRAVGTANGRNPIAIIIPCHRVIGNDGSLTGYAGGLDKKEKLLRHEGALEQLSLF